MPTFEDPGELRTDDWPGGPPRVVDYLARSSRRIRNFLRTRLSLATNIDCDVQTVRCTHGIEVQIKSRLLSVRGMSVLSASKGAQVEFAQLVAAGSTARVKVYFTADAGTADVTLILWPDGNADGSSLTYYPALRPGQIAGTDGQVLTRDSTQPAGAKWAASVGSGQVDFIQTRRWGGYTPSGTVLNALLQFGIQTPTFVGTGPTAQPFSERDTVQFTAAAAAAAVGGMQGPFTETRPFFRPKVSCIFIFDNRAGHNTNARMWFGLASSALSGLAPKIGSAASAIHFIGLAYDATVSPNFIIDSGDGTNHSGIDSGYAVPAGLNYFMVTLDWTSNGSLAWSISAEPFQSGAYNQALEAWTLVASGTKSTNLSATTTQDLGVVLTVTSSGATTGNLNLGKLMLEQN